MGDGDELRVGVADIDGLGDAVRDGVGDGLGVTEGVVEGVTVGVCVGVCDGDAVDVGDMVGVALGEGLIDGVMDRLAAGQRPQTAGHAATTLANWVAEYPKLVADSEEHTRSDQPEHDRPSTSMK